MKTDEEIYDRIYTNGGAGGEYRKHYSESMYFPIWRQVLKYIRELHHPYVFEIGCGVGAFGNMLLDAGGLTYIGVDFSEIAINQARQTNVNYAHRFLHGNIYRCSLLSRLNYDVVVALEVLEHLENDIPIVQSVKPGKVFIFSVPNFPAETHYRVFDSPGDIQKRYSGELVIGDITPFFLNKNQIIYLVYSWKK